MLYYAAAALGSLVIGLCIGWCGIAGFLLPILFMQFYGLSVSESLFLSFVCFAVSGAIGAMNYRRRGELEMKPALAMGIGSLMGGLLGAGLGGLLSADTAKTILYAVVLISGLSILRRELSAGRGREASGRLPRWALALLGFATAVICAASGAGGPVLVMPLLVVLGYPVKLAVGMALMDSVFIALPAIAVYGGRCDAASLAALLAVSAASHAVGVFVGSMTARHVPQALLKRGVAVFSICFALYKLFL